MDHGACSVIYLDRRAHPERLRRDNVLASLNARDARGVVSSPGYFNFGRSISTQEVLSNVETLLSIFHEIDIHRSGSAALDRIWHLYNSSSLDNAPIIVLIDLPYDEERRMKRLSREPRTPSPTASRTPGGDPEPEDLYGMHLLRHISAEIQDRRLPKVVIPVILLSGLDREMASDTASPGASGSRVLTDTVRLTRYLDAGAVDVLASPLSKDHIHGLAVHAYRINKEVMREKSSFLAQSKGRKVSWVGVNEAKPFSYLREAMVSNLMGNICCPDTARDTIDPHDIEVSPERREKIARAVGTWAFSAHDWNDDELLFGSLVMIKHALSMPEVERWRIREDELLIFLQASRNAYNEFVLYHNFRHVVDVLQALFYFLLRIGALPAYSSDPSHTPVEQPPIASLLKPFDALTLLISAIGHDVGHPGVNNAFLVALNAPLAQLYNDRSVLESFYCAAYSQILRRYWPAAFEDVAMRKLMINSILATDMGLHFKYMADLGNLQEKLAHNNGGIDGWSPKVLEEYRDLICGLLIKCADISNVARNFNTAVQWAAILTDEFSNQGQMEQELALPTCLFGGPPVRDDIIKLGESQIGFMNIFARPLFESVADILPNMRFSVVEIIENKVIWQKKIEEAKERLMPQTDGGVEGTGSSILDQARSPLSTSRVDVSDPRPAAPERTESTSSSLKAPKQTFPPPLNLSDTPRRASPALKAASEPRRSSVAALPIPRHLIEGQGNRNPHSRRGSADASLTTILVTQNPTKPSEKVKKKGLRLRSQSPGKRRNSRQGLGFFRHKTQPPPQRSDSPVRPSSSSAPPVPPLPPLSNDPPTHDRTTASSLQTDFVIQPRVPGSPGYPPANGTVHSSKNLQPPQSGAHSPVSPISVDSDYEIPPHVNAPLPSPKPTSADGQQVGGEAPPLPRWKTAGSAFKSRHSRKGSLTPSLTGFDVQPPETSSSADKSAHTMSESPTLHTLEGIGEGTSGRPKSRGGVFGRFWRRKIRGDKTSSGDLQQDKEMAVQTQGFQYPPPPKTPVNREAAGPRRGSMPLLPGSFPDTPPYRRQERDR
ncbi:3',5'-cyclic-nucleotide phosphodiesterase regA [Diplodia seriata]|uniref:Phosphodiesterase n=1 Tax=Diplodia seriata TaxID=420778 RepID=A0A1S8BHP8_9PEZI|nr:3',5'-cyclic-nucleotide phosphodiesterase regA [Diplodia seriata]